MQNQSSSMLTLSSIEPEMNGFGWYHAVTRELFHAKTMYFHQLNVCKHVPFHLGIYMYTQKGGHVKQESALSLVHVLSMSQLICKQSAGTAKCSFICRLEWDL